MNAVLEYQARVDAEVEKIRDMATRWQQEQEAEVAEIIKIFGKTKCGFFPYRLLNEVFNKACRMDGSSITFTGLSAVYMAGYVAGIRAERSRRKVKSPTTAATGGGAGQEDTKQATDIIPQNQ